MTRTLALVAHDRIDCQTRRLPSHCLTGAAGNMERLDSVLATRNLREIALHLHLACWSGEGYSYVRGGVDRTHIVHMLARRSARNSGWN